MRPRPVADSSTPTGSKPLTGGPWFSGTVRNTMIAAMMPTGMLTRKAQRHEKSSASHPPSSGPSPAAPPNTAPHRPKATARWRPVNSTLMTAIELGSIMAAPIAWTARAAIRKDGSWADPLASDPSRNTAMPDRKSRRRPYLSASSPTVMSRAANSSE